MTPALSVIESLAARNRVLSRVALVVAHPDDETLALGGHLALFADLRLIVATDGAPRDGRDAAAAGCETVEDYAGLRRRELACALKELGVAVRPKHLGFGDGETVFRLAGLVDALSCLEGADVVLTHAYEGGHADHDAVAFAVHAAVRLLAPRTAIEIVEFPSYSPGADGSPVFGRFHAGNRDATALELDFAQASRKRAALACFRTQRATLDQFPIAFEWLRRAPAYDFRQRPGSVEAIYETWGSPVGGPAWRHLAGKALETFQLDAACL